MLNIIALQNGEFNGATNTVVGTKSGALSSKPFAINIGLDGVFVEIKLYIDKFIANHVHVALQYDRLAVFIAWSGSLADNDVADFIDMSVQTMAFTPVSQVLNHFLFTF